MSRDVKSIYGLKMMEATYNGMLRRNNYAIRPFVLTRSAYFGSQKYGAKWTGDNSATYDDLRIAISQLLSLFTYILTCMIFKSLKKKLSSDE